MNKRTRFLRLLVIVMITMILTAHVQAGTPSPTGDGPPPQTRHSFLDPVGDFLRDDIVKPVQPFQLVPGKDPNGWSMVLEPYAWAMGLTGDVGVKGHPPSHINFSSRTVIQSLDWGIFMRGEVRKGRWGVLADGYYAALSGAGNLNNKVYDHVSLNLQQSLVSMALAYRVIDDRRGFFDVYAGARYNFIGLQTTASLNDSRINEIGSDAANLLASQAETRIDAAIQSAIARALPTLENQIVQTVEKHFSNAVLEKAITRDPSLRRLVHDEVIFQSLAGKSVQGAFRDHLRAVAAAELASARGLSDPRLDVRVAQTKKKLGQAIASQIEDAIPTYATGDQWWIDPIIGLRGQVNLTRWLFLAAQSDVGGFGAGSQMAWNVQATIGVNFTRNIFAEIGYRYMYVDYTNGGFLYQMSSYGLYSGVGVKF